MRGNGFIPERTRTSAKTWGILILLSGVAIVSLYVGFMFLIHKNSYGHLHERPMEPILLIGLGLAWLVMIGIRIRRYIKQKSLSHLAEVIGSAGILVGFVGTELGSFPTRYLLLAFAFFALAVALFLAQLDGSQRECRFASIWEQRKLSSKRQAGTVALIRGGYMKQLPETEDPLVLRTDFSDQSAGQ